MDEIFEKLSDTKATAQAAGDVDAANMIEGLMQQLAARSPHPENAEPFQPVKTAILKQ